MLQVRQGSAKCQAKAASCQWWHSTRKSSAPQCTAVHAAMTGRCKYASTCAGTAMDKLTLGDAPGMILICCLVGSSLSSRPRSPATSLSEGTQKMTSERDCSICTAATASGCMMLGALVLVLIMVVVVLLLIIILVVAGAGPWRLASSRPVVYTGKW